MSRGLSGCSAVDDRARRASSLGRWCNPDTTYRHESSYRALLGLIVVRPVPRALYLRIPLDLRIAMRRARASWEGQDRAHTVVPGGEGPHFFIFGSYLPYIVTVPPQGELDGF